MNILYTKEHIAKRTQELAKQIATDYKNQSLILVSILKGSFLFSADIIRALHEAGLTDVSIDFMQISSYGAKQISSKEPKIISDVTLPLFRKHILIIDDILDTGHTLHLVKNHLEQQNPASIKLLVVLDKPEKREIPLHADYVGFTIQGAPWVEGYGLDTNELGRGNPEIIDKS